MEIAIIGCGYVGIAAGRLLQREGHRVVGVRRSDEGLAVLREAGLEAVQADVTDPGSLGAVPGADALIFAASTGGGGAEAARAVFVEGLRNVISEFGDRDEPPERLVYTSSTGVYGNLDGGWVDEETAPVPSTPKTEVLLEAEGVARSATSTGMRPTVVRFGGLYGPERYRLERYLEGPVTDGTLNMLHREDAAGILSFVLGLAEPPTLLLAVDNEPVDRWVFANWLARACGRPLPAKITAEQRLVESDPSRTAERRLRSDKRCSNARLRDLGYTFSFPTFREGYTPAVEALSNPPNGD